MPPILYDYLHWPMAGVQADARSVAALLWIMFGIGAIVAGFYLVMRLAGRYRVPAPRALTETAFIAAFLSVLILVLGGQLGTAWLFYAMPLPLAVAGYALWDSRGRKRSRSETRTAWLRIVLDHEGGIFDGKVIKGVYRGRALSTMTLDELRLLQVELVADIESVNILNAYLDFAHAGARRSQSSDSGADNTYRTNNGGRRESRSGVNGGMSEEEAWNLLGLAKGASAEDIKQSYRRLMKQVHPDHGGTAYLAQKMTEAKNLLLDL